MNPRTPDNTIVYAVANFRGYPWRAEAAHQLIMRDAHDAPSEEQRVIVYMGNCLSFYNYSSNKLRKIAKERANRNIATLNHVISFELRNSKKIFLRGEQENNFAMRRDDSDGIEKTLENATPSNRERMLNDVFRAWMTAANASVKAIQGEQLQFIENLRTEHTEGDYLFCKAADSLPEGKYGIFSREGSSGLWPHISDKHWLAFNIATLQAVAVLKLRGEERQLIVAGGPAMDNSNHGSQRVTYDKIADGTFKYMDEVPYRFKRQENLQLSGGNTCYVWTSPVPVLG